MPQLRSIVSENDNPQLTDIAALKGVILKAARDELDVAVGMVR